MNHRHALLFLIAALVILVLGNAVFRAIARPEPPMVIDELWTDASASDVPCVVVPLPQAQGIPVQPSDAWRIV